MGVPFGRFPPRPLSLSLCCSAWYFGPARIATTAQPRSDRLPSPDRRLRLGGACGLARRRLRRRQRLDDRTELRECRGIFRAHRRVLAARIGALQSAAHGARKGDGIAAVAVVADQVEFSAGFDVAGEAIAAESIVYVLDAPNPGPRTRRRDVEVEKFPIASGAIRTL